MPGIEPQTKPFLDLHTNTEPVIGAQTAKNRILIHQQRYEGMAMYVD